MSETALRDLLEHAVTSDEPPLHTDVLRGAVRAARTARRRRLVTGVAVMAVIIPGIALSATFLASGLGPAAAQHAPVVRLGPVADGAAGQPLGAGRLRGWGFARPTLPRNVREVVPVPVTASSLGQLLIDDMPAGVRLPEVRVTPKDGLDPRSASMGFANLTTSAGAGFIDGNLVAPSPQNRQWAQCTGSYPCVRYRLPGGVVVMEKVQPDFAQTPGWVVYRVSVYRPRGASYWIQANNYAISGGPALAARPPLTFAQLAKIALDPRWGFTISRSFVAAARNLKVTGDGVG